MHRGSGRAREGDDICGLTDEFRLHEARGTSDAQMRKVIVFRRLGTPMALSRMIAERFDDYTVMSISGAFIDADA